MNSMIQIRYLFILSLTNKTGVNKKGFVLLSILFVFLMGCEEVYNANIELREGVLVVDARIVDGENENIIKVYKSLGFNEAGSGYPNVTGAQVFLVDEDNNQHELPETTSGSFRLNLTLDETKQYKLKIDYEGDIYESEFEKVPERPLMDTIYGLAGNKILQRGAGADITFIERPGVMLYTDIDNDLRKRYYRFSARKTFQYVYYIPNPVLGDLTVFAWSTVLPIESFNIAAPAKYSATVDITKHPLYFLEERTGIELGQSFAGWILFLHQYSISENAHNFYVDLNNQLEAEGRLFDPLYVQARNNLKCVTNPDNLVLGNFEIARHREYRFFIWFLSDEDGYLIKPIPYFYEIPPEGESIEEQPDFWETPSKKYPNED